MSEQDWAALEDLARELVARGVRVTPGQVAAQLLRGAIASQGPSGRLYPRSGPPRSFNAGEVGREYSSTASIEARREALRKADIAAERPAA